MRTVVLLSCLLALVACSKKPPTAPEAPASQVDPVPPSPPRVDQGILAELAREAAARPGAHPSVEETLAAFESAGIAIARKQQVLATPLGARYCVIASSKVGLNMALCEFDTVEHARTGKERSETQGKAMPGRSLFLVERTLLTLIVHRPEPAIVAQRDEATKRFRALSAR